MTRLEDEYALSVSLRDALKCCRRLARCSDSQAYDAAVAFVATLRKLGAKDLG